MSDHWVHVTHYAGAEGCHQANHRQTDRWEDVTCQRCLRRHYGMSGIAAMAVHTEHPHPPKRLDVVARLGREYDALVTGGAHPADRARRLLG